MAESERDVEQRKPAAEGMEDDAGRPVISEGRGHIVIGLASMDDGRLSGRRCRRQLQIEDPALRVPGRVIVVVVKAHLAGRDNAGMRQPLREPFCRTGGPGVRDVGMHTGGGREEGVRLRQLERAVGRGHRFADHDDVSETGFAGPRHHFGAVGVVGPIAEVAVRVHEHVRRPAAPCVRPPTRRRAASSARACADPASAARWP